MRFASALFAFMALPGMVAFLIPLAVIRAPTVPWTNPLGFLPLVVGTLLLVWCVRDFYVAGKGTLAPWDPPKHLVTVGLYRRSRNPMYVAVTLILIGWAIGFRSTPLLAYAALIAVLFHLRVVYFEEPFLARTHGTDWIRYRSTVRRWL